MGELNWKHKKLFYIIGSVLVLILGFYFKSKVDNSSFKILQADLTTISGLVIKTNLVYVESHGKATNEHIEFQVKNYSKTFSISGFDYECSIPSVLNDIKLNDTVAIKIPTKTYIDLKNDDISYTNIDIHSIVFKGKEYCDLDCRNDLQKNDGKVGTLICFIMSPLLMLIGLLKNEPKLGKTKIDISLLLAIILLILVFVLH